MRSLFQHRRSKLYSDDDTTALRLANSVFASPSHRPVGLDELMRGVAGGDRTAFTMLYDRPDVFIFRLAYLSLSAKNDRLSGETAVEQAEFDVWMRIWQVAPELLYRPGNPLSSPEEAIEWIMKTAHQRLAESGFSPKSGLTARRRPSQQAQSSR